jgi:5-methyltetrahydropteroyltriglutamate--homocysteine methyltransferase
MTPSIRTTVVGSYPIPSWLAAMPTTGNLRDAVLVVLKTQELAGIDVLTDGELSRFDVNHPETNGMIDYFVRPLQGFDTRLTRSEMEDYGVPSTAARRRAPETWRRHLEPAGCL